MTLIPGNEVTMEDLKEWYRLQDELKVIRKTEMLLRTKIFQGLFVEPKEGTNSMNLPDSYVLKAKHNITRELDPGAFAANRDRFVAAGIYPDTMVQYKPSLVLSAYRELTSEQAMLFDECLIIKPGSPSLEIVLPAKAKKAIEAAKEAALHASHDNS